MVQTPAQHGIPNFRWVCMEDSICAGGEPGPEGFAWLLEHGITNVVKLNSGHEIPAGMNVTQLEVTAWEQMFGGKEMAAKLDAAALLALMPATFVHCTHGANRTGAVILRRRIAMDGWSLEAAFIEADDHGWESSWPGLKAYVKRLTSPRHNVRQPK
jgi:hypothetical protein